MGQNRQVSACWHVTASAARKCDVRINIFRNGAIQLSLREHSWGKKYTRPYFANHKGQEPQETEPILLLVSSGTKQSSTSGKQFWGWQVAVLRKLACTLTFEWSPGIIKFLRGREKRGGKEPL